MTLLSSFKESNLFCQTLILNLKKLKFQFIRSSIGNLALPGNYTFSKTLNLLNLEFLNQTKNIPVIVLSSSPIKPFKSMKGFASYDWTYKQSNKQTSVKHARDLI